MFSLSSPVHLRAGVSLQIGLSMEMKYPIQSRTRCVYWNLKESNYLKSNRELELKSTATVRSLYNVFEITSKQVKPSLLKMQAMEKESEAGRNVKEDERRRKIGLANRGKVPWNKGRKHTEDTRRRIKERTIEALRNPKVMSSSG